LWRYRCVEAVSSTVPLLDYSGTDSIQSLDSRTGLGAMYEWSDIVKLVVDEYGLKRREPAA
jgi:hypothetical protein